jgi:hypothetical protein
VGRKTGIVLVGIGAFLLVLAPLLRFYAYDRLAVVPLDQETVSISEGPGATIFSIADGEEITVDLQSTRNVVGDVEASEEASDEQGQDLAIWETFVFTGPEGEEFNEDNPPLSATHDRVVFDRNTGEAVACCGQYTSSGADPDTGEEIRDTDTPIEGQYFKLPFGAEKRDYEFWDGSIQEATTLAYQDTEEIEGLEVYRYEQVIEPTDVGDLPEGAGSLFGVDDPDATIDRVYSNTRTLWIEPETGVIIRGQEDQYVTAEYEGEQVATLTDVVIGYDDATITDNVDTYSSLATALKAVRLWAPLASLVLGLLLVVGGALLIVRDRRRSY